MRSEPNHDDADEARFLIGRAQVRQERHDDARRSFEWILNSKPRSEWAARSLEQLALLYERSRNPVGALDARRRMLRDHPNSPTTARVWLEIAADHFRAEQYQEAVEIYAKFESTLDDAQRNRHTVAAVLAGHANDPAAVLEHLEECLVDGRIDSALSLARALQRQFPRHPAALVATLREAQALTARSGREHAEQARDLFQRVLNDNRSPDDLAATARWELVRVHAGPLGEVDTALEHCEQAIQTLPPGQFRHQQAMYTRAWLLWARQRFEPALEAFEEFAEAYPEQGASAAIQRYIADCQAGDHLSLRPGQSSR